MALTPATQTPATRAVGPGQHALERRGFVVTAFNWGGAAIYLELKPTPLAVACASSSAQVGVPYGSPLLTSGGQPDYNYAITSSPGLPPGLILLGLSNPNIYGKPTTAGTYPYTVKVTDSASSQTSSSCSITVAPLRLPYRCDGAAYCCTWPGTLKVIIVRPDLC